jgi:hypothetical protein
MFSWVCILGIKWEDQHTEDQHKNPGRNIRYSALKRERNAVCYKHTFLFKFFVVTVSHYVG